MRYVIILFSILIAAKLPAQTYEINKDTKDPGVKVLQGKINKYLLQNDTAFSRWYISSQSIYKPDTAILNAFERTRSILQFVVFGGTWCDDTQFVLPKFFKLQEMSGVPDANISFFGVNRSKKALDNITETFAITNVPTIIILKDGKELGRVVEYGKTGKWDKELTDIINAH